MPTTPFMKITLSASGEPELTPDLQGDIVSREAYEELEAKLAAARHHAFDQEGMAECMRDFREAMINAGIVGESCPPMFMIEGVSNYILKLASQVAKARLDLT
jgi:hypothetical protein